MVRRPLLALLGLALAAPLALAVAGSQPAAGADRVPVKALVMATFPSEASPWFAREGVAAPGQPGYLTIGGLVTEENPDGAVRCNLARGLCVTIVGTTKSKSGPSTMALLKDPQLDLSRAKFLLVGIAGISTWNGTIGDAGVADQVIDTDLGTPFLDPQDGNVRPGMTHLQFCELTLQWCPFDTPPLGAYDQAIYRLPLGSWAFELTRNVVLADDQASRTERGFYGPAEAREAPRVRHCNVAGNDAFWLGAREARQQDAIAEARQAQAGLPQTGRCTSAFEDPGVAGALRRFGFLDRLVVVRTGSDFEDQRPTGSAVTGRTPLGLYELLHTDQGFAAFSIAVENEWRVGTAVARAWTG
jgi:purine nucleoside permease